MHTSPLECREIKVAIFSLVYILFFYAFLLLSEKGHSSFEEKTKFPVCKCSSITQVHCRFPLCCVFIAFLRLLRLGGRQRGIR